MKRRQTKNVNKRFQGNGKLEHDVTDDASQIKAKDLRKGKTKGSFYKRNKAYTQQQCPLLLLELTI
jgi:hypothetical protein